jgi:hypothetical protein
MEKCFPGSENKIENCQVRLIYQQYYDVFAQSEIAQYIVEEDHYLRLLGTLQFL